MNGESCEVPQVYLRPGEVHLSAEPAILKTILGSCVGLTFWSPRLKIGALCHGILPECPPEVRAPEGYRYVDFAIRELTRRFEVLGAPRKGLEVKVFGGAEVISRVDPNSRSRTVGQRNLEAAMNVLRKGDFNVIGCDVGGSTGRTMKFQTWDGHVFVRRHSGDTAGCNGSCRSGKGCRFLETQDGACSPSLLIRSGIWENAKKY